MPLVQIVVQLARDPSLLATGCDSVGAVPGLPHSSGHQDPAFVAPDFDVPQLARLLLQWFIGRCTHRVRRNARGRLLHAVGAVGASFSRAGHGGLRLGFVRP